jgi:hypothetical protein
VLGHAQDKSAAWFHSLSHCCQSFLIFRDVLEHIKSHDNVECLDEGNSARICLYQLDAVAESPSRMYKAGEMNFAAAQRQIWSAFANAAEYKAGAAANLHQGASEWKKSLKKLANQMIALNEPKAHGLRVVQYMVGLRRERVVMFRKVRRKGLKSFQDVWRPPALRATTVRRFEIGVTE